MALTPAATNWALERSVANRIVWVVVLATLLCGVSQAQLQPSAPAAEAELEVRDPFGRETPRSSFRRFIRAAESDKFFIAAEYLQFPGRLSRERRDLLIQQLRELLNRHYVGDINSISNDPEGSFNDELPADLERAGVISTSDEMLRFVTQR